VYNANFLRLRRAPAPVARAILRNRAQSACRDIFFYFSREIGHNKVPSGFLKADFNTRKRTVLKCE
jgi:hypothetical protein